MQSSVSERHPSESGSPEPLGPQHFPSPFTKRRDHPSTTRTTTTTTTDELLDDDPAPFCSTSLAPTLPALFLSLPQSLPVTYLPAYNPSSYRCLTQNLQPTPSRAAYPTAHFLASLSWPPYSLHFSLLISHPPTRQPLSCPSSSPPPSATVYISLFLSPSLHSFSFSLSLSLHRAFSCQPSILSPSCSPVLPPALSPSFSSGSSSSNPRIDFTLPTAQAVSPFLGR